MLHLKPAPSKESQNATKQSAQVQQPAIPSIPSYLDSAAMFLWRQYKNEQAARPAHLQSEHTVSPGPAPGGHGGE